MEDKANFKQRLIGGVALVLVGVVLFPLVFNAAGYKERKAKVQVSHESSAITEPSSSPLVLAESSTNREVSTLSVPTLPPPTPSTALAQVTPVAPVTERPANSAPVAEIAESLGALRPNTSQQEEPVLDEEVLSGAWTLQLASFRQESNARELRTRLTNSGYRVYLRHGEDVVRVFVGPEAERSRLEQLKTSLHQEYGLEGMIVRFTAQ